MKTKKRIIVTGANLFATNELVNKLTNDGTRTLKISADDNIENIEERQNTFFKDILKFVSSKKSYVSFRGPVDAAAETFFYTLTKSINKKTADKQYLKLQKFYAENPDILTIYVPVKTLENESIDNSDLQLQTTMDFFIKNLLDTANINYVTVEENIEDTIKKIEDLLNK